MADFKVNGRVFTVDEADIKDIMKENDMDRDMAVRCYFQDYIGVVKNAITADITEIKTEKAKRRYVKSDKPRKQTERVRKVDEVKKNILTKMAGTLDVSYTMKNEAEFSFTLDGVDYTVKLVKHRPPKAEKV